MDFTFSSCHHDCFGAPKTFDVEVSTGTTIMACEYDGGVMMGADSRTSSGVFVANRATDKLTKVTNYIYCCRSGSAADTQAVVDVVAYQLYFYKNDTGQEPTVAIAAATFRDTVYRYREQISAGLIVGGWDEVNGGQVYSVGMGGLMKRQRLSMGGSGSTYIYGFADATYRQNMSQAECREFMVKSIGLAISRDGSSGGVIRLGTINDKGISKETVKYSDISDSVDGSQQELGFSLLAM